MAGPVDVEVSRRAIHGGVMTKIRFLIVAPASYIFCPSEEFDFLEEVIEITKKVELSPFGDSFELISRSGLSVKRLGTLLLRHHPRYSTLSPTAIPRRALRGRTLRV